MRVQDAGAERRAPGLQGWGGGGETHADVEGTAGEGLSPPDYALHPPPPPPFQPLRAWPCPAGGGGLCRAGPWAGRGGDLLPPPPPACTRGGSTQPSAVGSSWYPPGSSHASPPPAPSSILLSTAKSNHSWSIPAAQSPVPRAPNPLPCALSLRDSSHAPRSSPSPRRAPSAVAAAHGPGGCRDPGLAARSGTATRMARA